MSWKNTADIPKLPTAHATASAIGWPSVPQRVEHERSATTTTDAVPGCSKSRTMSGLKLVRLDCGQSTADIRSPGCQSRSPT